MRRPKSYCAKRGVKKGSETPKSDAQKGFVSNTLDIQYSDAWLLQGRKPQCSFEYEGTDGENGSQQMK
ncbi:hypothetical protein GBA52_018807 [Prunus armeniaca]|nr:hypothetical protein GBA52_018807 [Prunus armeniaca]